MATTAERAPALDEQETVFTIEATDRNFVFIFSNDQVWQKRIEKFTEAYKRNEYGRWYKVSLEEFGFGLRKKRVLTEEQRQAMGERLARMRDAQNDDDDFGDE
jgi:hypothetical protein